MGPIRSPSRESARHEDAQKRLISATAAAQKRRVGGLAYESQAALRGWRSGEQAGTCSAVLGAAGESRERGRGWPPRAAKAKYRTILRRSERKAVSWLWGGAVLRGPGAPSCSATAATAYQLPFPISQFPFPNYNPTSQFVHVRSMSPPFQIPQASWTAPLYYVRSTCGGAQTARTSTSLSGRPPPPLSKWCAVCGSGPRSVRYCDG